MFKIESYRKGIVLSTVFNVFNKGLVFLNGIIVAYFFGRAEGTDFFFYVYNSLIILAAFIMNTNGSVIVPESMRIRIEKGDIESMKFLNFFLYLYSSLVLISIVLIFIDPISFFAAVSNFTTGKLSSNRLLLYLSVPLFGMICIITLLSDIMVSYKFFTTSMITGIVNGVVSILFMATLHEKLGIKSVFIGFLISYVINLGLLIFLLKRHLKWKFFVGSRVLQKRIWKNLGFAQLGNITSTASLYTPIYIFSGSNVGIITALTFAQQISTLPNALITTQFSSVAGIKFNELYAEKKFLPINTIFLDCASMLHFLMIPMGLIFFTYSSEIINLVLGFTSVSQATSEYASMFLKYLGLLLPLLTINTLMARLFMASHKVKEAFSYQVSFNIVLIGCLYAGVMNLGIVGYPVAMLLTYFLNLLFCYLLSRLYFPFLNYFHVLKEFAILLLVNILIIFAVANITKVLRTQESLITITVAGTLYCLILLVTNRVLRLNKLVTIHLRDVIQKIMSYGTTGNRR